ncbi:MAG: NAD(P)H-dependent oxidoreductase [Dechloromonas sp.]|uniref:NAD(P)H-dependent oxidoreductase n=1 Tax=Candidatus Dechloromonas phosphorivorans TaxID=2899244 RepID=A0A9D7LUS5_9RHOO|nr:NAD(P)H-dependent oxidoreductase [Candidatus Dechloromonas phosphorivorans]
MGEIKILGILGCERQGSYSRFALHAARELLPHGTALELIDLNGIPFFDRRRALSPPPAVVEFRRRVLDSDAILFATPECIHSVPGKLKSAIDWASSPAGESPWLDKPTAVMSASDGRLIKARAQHHLKEVMATLKMQTVDHPGMTDCDAGRHFSDEGKLHHESARCFIQELLAALVSLVKVNRAATGYIVRKAA